MRERSRLGRYWDVFLDVGVNLWFVWYAVIGLIVAFVYG